MSISEILNDLNGKQVKLSVAEIVAIANSCDNVIDRQECLRALNELIDRRVEKKLRQLTTKQFNAASNGAYDRGPSLKEMTREEISRDVWDKVEGSNPNKQVHDEAARILNITSSDFSTELRHHQGNLGLSECTAE